MPISARSPAALWDFQNIQQHLCCDSFNSVVIDFAAHSFQRQPPWIDVPCGHFDLCFLQLAKPRHNGSPHMPPIDLGFWPDHLSRQISAEPLNNEQRLADGWCQNLNAARVGRCRGWCCWVAVVAVSMPIS